MPIDFQAIVNHMEELRNSYVPPVADPFAEFEGRPVVYKPDGTQAFIRGANGNVLIIMPDGSTSIQART